MMSPIRTQVSQGLIKPFRIDATPLSHAATDFARVRRHESTPPLLAISLCLQYLSLKEDDVKTYPIKYSDMFEPYVVIRRSHLRFPHQFSGYGFNKIAFVMQLHAAGYQFRVLQQGWLLHMPHTESKEARSFSSNIEQRLENRLLRYASWFGDM